MEKAYVDLAKSHGELIRSHDKIKKRVKKRDKFFTRTWKGVKRLWKVLNANELFPSSRLDESVDVPTVWSDDDDADTVTS